MIDMPSWTNGPWVVGVSADDDSIHCVDTSYPHKDGGGVVEICKIWGVDVDVLEDEESLANAKLISQSPAMADVLVQWAAAEAMDDDEEMHNARQERDRIIKELLE